MKRLRTKEGVSLIVLVITIIVMIVLAGAVILALNNSGIIGKANMGRAKSDLSTLMEEVQVKAAERKLNGLDVDGRYKLSDWGIESPEYEDRVIIDSGKLKVSNKGKNDELEKVAKELGILTNTANAVLENTTGESLLDYKIYGNTIQGGNLLDKNNVNYIIGYFFRSKPVVTTHANARTIYIECKPNTSYEVTRSASFSQFHIGCTSDVPEVGMEVKNVVSADKTTQMRLKTTTDDTAKYLVIYCYNGYEVSDNWEDIVNSMVVSETPSINSSVQIQSLGDLVTDTNDANYGKYKIPVKITGKNLIDVSKYYKDYLNDKNEMNYVQSDFVKIKDIYIPVDAKENTVYTFSCDYEIYTSDTTNENGNGIFLLMMDKDKNVISKKDWASKGEKITGKASISSKSDKQLAYISISYVTATRDCTVKLTNIQLEENDVATTYEPYQGEKNINVYLNEPLRKTGDYADYIDFKEKKVVRNVKSELSANKAWSYRQEDDIIYYGVKNARYEADIFCNYIPSETKRIDGMSYVRTVDEVVRIYNRGYWESLDAFKNWLADKKDFEVIYPLITPTEESITLPDIPTFKGTTIISVRGTNGIEASNIVAEY